MGSNFRGNPQTFASKGYSKFEFRSLRHRVNIISNLERIVDVFSDFRANLQEFGLERDRRAFLCRFC